MHISTDEELRLPASLLGWLQSVSVVACLSNLKWDPEMKTKLDMLIANRAIPNCRAAGSLPAVKWGLASVMAMTRCSTVLGGIN